MKAIAILLASCFGLLAQTNPPTARGTFERHEVVTTVSGLFHTGNAITTNIYTQPSLTIPFDFKPNAICCRSNFGISGVFNLDFPSSTPQGRIGSFNTIFFEGAPMEVGSSVDGVFKVNPSATNNFNWELISTLNMDVTDEIPPCPEAAHRQGPPVAPGFHPFSISPECTSRSISFPIQDGDDLLYEIKTSLSSFMFARSNPPNSRIIFHTHFAVRSFYRVGTSAGIELSDTLLLFSVGETNPPPQIVELKNNGSSNLNFTVSSLTGNGPPWLTVTPESGTLAPQQTTNLTVSIDPALLPPGPTNVATVSVSGNTRNSPQTFTVEVTRVGVRLIGLEVVQTVQDWRNSVPLVAGKATTVRAHFQSPTPILQRVTSQLRGFRNGVEILPRLDPSNPGGSIFAKTNGADARAHLNGTLNFALPPSWTTGVVTFQLETNSIVCGEIAGTPDDCAYTAEFFLAPTPTITLVHVPWVDTNGVTNTRSMAQIADLIPRIIATFPITNVDFEISEMKWTPRSTPDLDAILEQLDLRRQLDAGGTPTNRIYYAVVPVDSVNGLGRFPGFVAAGFLPISPFGAGRYTFPHEVAHNLQRDHAPYCGAVVIDPATVFPYVGVRGEEEVPLLGPLFGDPNDIVFGFDHQSREVVSPYKYFEIMGYCRAEPLERWPSKHTYEALISAVSNHFKAPPVPATNAAGDYLFVRGKLELATGAVSLAPFTTLRTRANPELPEAGPFRVRLRNQAGQILNEIPFAIPIVLADDEPPTHFSFIVPVAHDPAIRSVEIVNNNNEVKASRIASVHPPSVRVLSPNGGENLAGNEIPAFWTGADSDNDPLTYAVQYSPDNGATWQTLAVDLIATHYAFSRSSVPASNAVRLRVIASDGFHSVMDTSDAPAQVAANAPAVEITTPGDHDLFAGAQQIRLEALGFDAEDGLIDGNHLIWASDVDGPLGSGQRIDLSAQALSEGAHLIRVTATDSTGLTASDEVTIFVANVAPMALADLALVQSVEIIGNQSIIEIQLENRGPSEATGVRLTDELPLGATLVSLTTASGNFIATNRLVTYFAPNLPAGGIVTITLRLQLTQPGIYANIVDVKGAEIDPVLANNLTQTSFEFTISGPRLAIQLEGNLIKISWPTSSDLVLRASPSLLSGTWLDVSQNPIVKGNRFEVMIPLANGHRFYRLEPR